VAAEGGGVVVAFWDGILLELRESWWLMLDGSGGGDDVCIRHLMVFSW